MDTPLISFIIPFYGEASRDLLRACLQSVRSQPATCGEDYEIIVCGEGATSTGEARNQGIDRARGEYLCFVDADDRLRPGALPAACLALGRERPDVLKCGGENRRYPSGADFMLRHNYTGVVWGQFFSRSLVEREGLRFSHTSFAEDEEFVAKAYACAGKFVVSPSSFYEHVRHGFSVTQRQGDADRLMRVEEFRAMLQRLHAYRQALPEGMPRRALGRRVAFLTIDYVRQLRRNRMAFSYAVARLRGLKSGGFLPLPDEAYGAKYRMARAALNLLTRFS